MCCALMSNFGGQIHYIILMHGGCGRCFWRRGGGEENEWNGLTKRVMAEKTERKVSFTTTTLVHA